MPLPPPPRLTDVHSYVTESEAEYFARVVNSLHGESNIHVDVQIELFCRAITAEAKKVFGESSTSEVCGSVAKGTNVASSDIDMYIDTDEPVSRVQRELLTRNIASLSMFHEHHVHLGRLAIHVCTIFGDIDVVCSNTVEYGIRPRHDPSLIEDVTLIQAIRALKIWIKHGRSGKVPGYKLEAMAKEIKVSYPISVPHCDGSMQLFISILQSIVDSGSGGKLFGLPGGTGAATDIFNHAKLTLHLFVCSRALCGSFRDANEVNGWLMCAVGELQVSEAGIIPLWMLSSEGRPPVNSVDMCLFEQYKPSKKKSADSCSSSLNAENSQHVLNLLRHSPIGAYTLTGAPDIDYVDDEAMLQNISKLQSLAVGGSRVAARMVAARKLWLQGMSYLNTGDRTAAVSLFGASLRNAAFNGDPFNGIFPAATNEMNLYKKACTDLMLLDDGSVDAPLVLAMIAFNESRPADAQSVLQRRLTRPCNDAYGVLYYYGVILGNRGLWDESYECYDRCVNLCPTEPIFYYWRAVTLGKIDRFDVRSRASSIIKEDGYFVGGAPPERPEVSQAHYEKLLAGINVDITSREGSHGEALKRKYLRAYAAAKAAETLTLEVFPPLSCKSKSLVAAMAIAFSSSTTDALRMLGNEAFKRQDFHQAVHLYSAAIEQTPSAELFSNRSAANSALEHFSCAARDAEDALQLRPEWSKAYFRLAVAHVGRKKYGAALEAASRALSLSPQDKFVQDLRADVKRKYSELGGRNENADFDLQLWGCWPRVMFKDRVVVIDPAGGFDYCTIFDAFSDCVEKYETKFTLVLRPGVHPGSITAVNESLVDRLTFQLLGWTDAASPDKRQRSELTVGREAHLVRLQGNVRCHIQQIVFNSKTAGEISTANHCIFARGGSEAIVENCLFRTSSNLACCSIEDPKSELNLRNCTFKSIWSAVLVLNEAVLQARHCKVTNSHRAGVEIRKSGRASLEDCTFDRCNSQAVVLYNGGGRLQLTRCVVSHCGSKAEHYSSVLVESGMACLRDCTVKDCSADAVLLQQAVDSKDPSPVLLMVGCLLERNYSGCSIHLGSGVISGNTIRSHVDKGVIIRHVPRGRKVFVRGNTIDRNGHNQDFIIQGETLFRESIVCDSCNTCSPFVMSDVDAAIYEASIRTHVDALGRKCR
jgi:tetratricopeptide (TPR) repeat protein/predicted nucleotidyltransferase